MKFLPKLFENNRAWAERIKREDPQYFERLSRTQTPDYLWIGCADRRVPANEIVGLGPGELFVHRNIANLAPPLDANVQCVLQYAVEALKVKHIIVCGHYAAAAYLPRFANGPDYLWRIGWPTCVRYTESTKPNWMPHLMKRSVGGVYVSLTSWLRYMRYGKPKSYK